MTSSDMKMKELGRSFWNDTHNITSLILTTQVYIRHLADGRSLHGIRIQANIHTHTLTRIRTHALLSSIISSSIISIVLSSIITSITYIVM